ncbi:LysR family transcriptional regulator [Stenotrophomonas rhizophila]
MCIHTMRVCMAMNWEDLRFLLAIRSNGTISGAARELMVDQATVSRRLQSLEATLGVRLIDRLPKEARFTTVGAEVVERVEAMQSNAFEIQRLLTSSRTETRREITITAPRFWHGTSWHRISGTFRNGWVLRRSRS